MSRTEKVIGRLDKYLSLVRYNYTSQEKLSRLLILKDYYASMGKTPSEEKFTMTIDFAEQLSGELLLPLKVRGVFLKEGRPKKKYYSAQELDKSTNNPVNHKFPIMLDHKDKEAGKIVGVVDKIAYDDKIRGIRWWGHINDETFARNILDKIITDVSATIYSTTEFDEILGTVGTDLTYGELSLVMKGAAEGNYIESY